MGTSASHQWIPATSHSRSSTTESRVTWTSRATSAAPATVMDCAKSLVPVVPQEEGGPAGVGQAHGFDHDGLGRAGLVLAGAGLSHTSQRGQDLGLLGSHLRPWPGADGAHGLPMIS